MDTWRLILRRALAYTLDILLCFVVLAPLAFGVERLLGLQPETAGQVWMAAILSFSLPVWAYFTLSDASEQGATLGKRITRVRVAPLDGAAKLGLGRALARTAVKLLPWELAHVFGFAVADRVGEGVQVAGLIAANALILLYLVIFLATGGRRSVHDLAVGTQVRPR